MVLREHLLLQADRQLLQNLTRLLIKCFPFFSLMKGNYYWYCLAYEMKSGMVKCVLGNNFIDYPTGPPLCLNPQKPTTLNNR